MYHNLYNFTSTLCPPEFILLPSFSLWPVPNQFVVLPTYSPHLPLTLLSCHLKQNQHVFGAGLWRGNCRSIRTQIINIFLHHKSHLLSCSTFVCIPSTPLLLVPTAFHHSLPAKLSFPLAFFSPTAATALRITPSLSSLSPTACLPSSFHLSSLKLTVPEGRGHLRTKWRISRQLCAHSLRWPSIIHSLLPPPFPSLRLPSALFISPCRLCLYLSVASSHRDCVSASLHRCYSLV